MIYNKFRGGPNYYYKEKRRALYQEAILYILLTDRFRNHKYMIFEQCKHMGPPVFKESRTLCGETVGK